LKLTAETVCKIEQALALVEFGEIVLVVHQGKITAIDIKSRKRMAVDKSAQHGVDSG